MSHCRAAFPSPTASSRGASWPQHCSPCSSISCSVRQEDMPDRIYIRFRTDAIVFNLRRLLARTKTTEELTTELLFADDCALLAYTEEAFRHIVNRFSDAEKNFGPAIGLNKNEVLTQPPSQDAFSPPQVSIDGTNLSAVEQFTYLGSVISNDATVSKDLDNRLSKASSSFGRLSKRIWPSRLLRFSTEIQGHRAVLYGAETWVRYRK